MDNMYIDFLSSFQDIHKCSKCERHQGETEVNICYVDEDCNNFLVSNLEPLCLSCYSQVKKSPFITVARKFSFGSAHFLPKYNGLCNRLHGHEWKIVVSINKRIDKQTGMILDFSELKKIVNKHVIEILDHDLINNHLANPTAENLCIWAWEQLMFKGLLKGISCIEIWETPKSCARLTTSGMSSLFKNNVDDYLEKYKIGFGEESE